MSTKTAKSAKAKTRSEKANASDADTDQMVRVALYQIKRQLLTDDTFYQLRKLNIFYLKELVKLMNTDATMREKASENSQIGSFVSMISSRLHAIANSHNANRFYK